MENTVCFRKSHHHIPDVNESTKSKSFQIDKGTKVTVDEQGRVLYAEYANGAMIQRHANYNLVRSSTDASYWFGDRRGCWYPLD